MTGTRIFIFFTRLACFLLAGLALVVEITTLQASVSQVYSDWQVLQSYSTLKTVIAFPTYAVVVLILRYLSIALFWLAGIVIYLLVSRGHSAHTGISLYTSLLLILFPVVFFSGFDPPNALLAPWGEFIVIITQFIIALVLLLLIGFYYLFPDGRLTPRWIGWIAIPLGLVMLILLFALSRGESQVEWLWPASMLTVLAGLLIGLASQLYRYFRMVDPVQKNQIKGVLLALVLFPLFLLIPSLLGAPAWAGLLNLMGSVAVPILLPLSLLWALLRRGLWQVVLSPGQKRRIIVLAGSLIALWMAGFGLAYQADKQDIAQEINLEPLPASSQPRSVVIDTDMAPDDWMAILFLLQRPDIHIRAITVSGTGETHCEAGVRNVLRLVALAGESDIPVACGRQTPLQGNQVFPAAWRARADDLLHLDAPVVEGPAEQQTAVELLQTTIQSSPKPVVVLTLGPLTNLAEAIQQDAALLMNIEQIYVMGGALQVLGNVGSSGVGIDNQVAEWNIFIDPLAFEQLLASGAPVSLVPLDATNQAPIDLDFYSLLQANHRTPEADFVYELLIKQLDFVASGGYYFWDPLAAALLVDESLGHFGKGNMVVITKAGASYGLTRLRSRGFPARYASSVEAGRFELEFLRTINQP